MKLQTFRHLWGVSGPFEKVLPEIKRAGYDGIECKESKVERDTDFKNKLLQYDFEFIAQIHTAGETVDEHMASFKELIEKSLWLNPIKINSQSGKDSWGMDEKNEFVTRALAYENEVGIPVAHETHRSRIFYNPWDTRDLLLSHSRLKLCCDFSHWVCVCERLLHSETGILQLCAERCIHLHSRVGYEQGPQVPDPRAPEYAAHLTAHETWWDMIWQTQHNKGEKISTITPEFGPPNYQHTLPYTLRPVSDIWDICNWMNDRQKERFQEIINNKQNATTSRNCSKPGFSVVK